MGFVSDFDGLRGSFQAGFRALGRGLIANIIPLGFLV